MVVLTESYTFKYGDDGFLFNTSDTTLPFVDIMRVEGLDSGDFRISTKDEEGFDGGTVENDFQSIRNIVVEGSLISNANNLEPTLRLLKKQFRAGGGTKPFYFLAPGVDTAVVFCKSYGFKYSWEQAMRSNVVEFQFQLAAEDPVIYSEQLFMVVATLGASGVTGRGYPRLYPLTYGGTSQSGSFNVVNNGDRPVGAKLVITGPVTNPTVINDTLGLSFTIQIDLLSTDTLTLDLGDRTVYLNSTASRYSLFHGDWFLLQVGTNQLRYQAQAQTASTLTLSYRYGYY